MVHYYICHYKTSYHQMYMNYLRFVLPLKIKFITSKRLFFTILNFLKLLTLFKIF